MPSKCFYPGNYKYSSYNASISLCYVACAGLFHFTTMGCLYLKHPHLYLYTYLSPFPTHLQVSNLNIQPMILEFCKPIQWIWSDLPSHLHKQWAWSCCGSTRCTMWRQPESVAAVWSCFLLKEPIIVKIVWKSVGFFFNFLYCLKFFEINRWFDFSQI